MRFYHNSFSTRNVHSLTIWISVRKPVTEATPFAREDWQRNWRLLRPLRRSQMQINFESQSKARHLLKLLKIPTTNLGCRWKIQIQARGRRMTRDRSWSWNEKPARATSIRCSIPSELRRAQSHQFLSMVFNYRVNSKTPWNLARLRNDLFALQRLEPKVFELAHLLPRLREILTLRTMELQDMEILATETQATQVMKLKSREERECQRCFRDGMSAVVCMDHCIVSSPYAF